MDEERTEALYDRVFSETTCALGTLVLYIGHQLGLFKVMAQTGPITAQDLANQTNLSERYVREWLLAVASSDYVETDETGTTFTLPDEHRAVLADEDSPYFLAAYPGVLQGTAIVMDSLIDAFKSGGGVPYEHYGEHLRHGIALSNRPMYQHSYVQKWIPAMPDVEAKLSVGARVADVGSGTGWSAVCLGKHFKNATIDGIDSDRASVDEARKLADEHSVSDRVQFHASTIEEFDADNSYDLVTAFECLHDMPYPVEVLSQMRRLAKPDGIVFIGDEAGGENFSDNHNLLGRLLYNVSVLHCLPQAMVFPDAAGTGTAISETMVRNYANEAGYSEVEVVSIEDPFFRFYRLTP